MAQFSMVRIQRARKAFAVLASVTLSSIVPALTPLAQAEPLSEASALSGVALATSVAGSVMILSAGAALAVVSVEKTAEGVSWVLERAADGSRQTLRVSARGAGAASVAAGTAITVSAFSAGWLLSAAGKAVAYVPNEVGAALLHNERIAK